MVGFFECSCYKIKRINILYEFGKKKKNNKCTGIELQMFSNYIGDNSKNVLLFI